MDASEAEATRLAVAFNDPNRVFHVDVQHPLPAFRTESLDRHRYLGLPADGRRLVKRQGRHTDACPGADSAPPRTGCRCR